MILKQLTKFHLFGILLGLTLLVIQHELALAAVMSSSNYEIQSDSINFGGAPASSASYESEDTLGEIATGPSASASYNLKAGYQQMQVTYLAMTAATDVSLSPSIDGSAGGAATGDTSVTVTTDNLTGYELSLKASSSPALISGANSFADYTKTGANPDFTFSIAAADSEFGFTPEGTDISDTYKDDGISCNTGALDTADSCWDNLSTTAKVIARRTSGNHPSGVVTTIKFQAESGASHSQAAGTYVATTTLTLTAL